VDHVRCLNAGKMQGWSAIIGLSPASEADSQVGADVSLIGVLKPSSVCIGVLHG